jgi:hypothetical protein
MFIDNELIFSNAQAVTAAAASTNIIDQGSAGAAAEDELYFIVSCTTAATAAGAATVNFQLQCDDNSGFSSPKVLLETGAIGKASLVAGYIAFKGRIPVGCERYIRAYYDVQTGPLTAGAFTAELVLDAPIQSV